MRESRMLIWVHARLVFSRGSGFPKVGETLIVDTLDLEHHA